MLRILATGEIRSTAYVVVGSWEKEIHCPLDVLLLLLALLLEIWTEMPMCQLRVQTSRGLCASTAPGSISDMTRGYAPDGHSPSRRPQNVEACPSELRPVSLRTSTGDACH